MLTGYCYTMKYHGIQRWPMRTREQAESKRNSISKRVPFVRDSLCRYLYIGAFMHVDISIWLSARERRRDCDAIRNLNAAEAYKPIYNRVN